jgi:tetratricopeptide (TPR) repeat protein
MLPSCSEIRQEIVNCCSQMRAIRDEKHGGKWEDYNGSGLVLTCEALTCFLTPALVIPEAKDTLLANTLTYDVLVKSLEEILRQSESGFYGLPYVQFKAISKDKKEHGFIDGACFSASVILSATKACEAKIPDRLREPLADTFRRSLDFILGSFIEGKGWSWGTYGKPEEPFLYATWTAAETIADVLAFESIAVEKLGVERSVIEELGKCLDVASKFLLERHVFTDEATSDSGVSFNAITGEVAFSKKDSHIYYNIWIALALLNSQEAPSDAIKGILDFAIPQVLSAEAKFLTRDHGFDLDSPKLDATAPFPDRALLPSALKALAMWGTNADAGAALAVTDQLSDVYNLVITNRKQGNYVWDRFARDPENSGYAIYYTERAIEALCRVYTFVEGMGRKGLADLSTGQFMNVWQDIGFKLHSLRDDGDDKSFSELSTRISDFESAIAQKVSSIERRVEKLEQEVVDPAERGRQRAAELLDFQKQVETLEEQRDYGEALAVIDKALAIAPDHPWFKDRRREARRQQQQIEKIKSVSSAKDDDDSRKSKGKREG